MRRFVFLIVLCTMLLYALPNVAAKDSEPLRPGLIQLIANPERYSGKVISVLGFLVIQHESDALYLHREDYEHALLENSIWIDTTEEMGKNKGMLNLKYVSITGTFRAGGDGLQQSVAGGLTKITFVEVWSDPLNPKALRRERH